MSKGQSLLLQQQLFSTNLQYPGEIHPLGKKLASEKFKISMWDYWRQHKVSHEWKIMQIQRMSSVSGSGISVTSYVDPSSKSLHLAECIGNVIIELSGHNLSQCLSCPTVFCYPELLFHCCLCCGRPVQTRQWLFHHRSPHGQPLSEGKNSPTDLQENCQSCAETLTFFF